MIHVSLTRLRIRSVRFMPGFGWYAFRTNRQVRGAEGFLGGALLPDREWTFWTMTAWENRAAMLAYMTSGDHKRAMPKLLNWCDEASVAGWEQESAVQVSWEEADRRMRAIGRASKVRRPSEVQARAWDEYREPRVTRGGVILPER